MTRASWPDFPPLKRPEGITEEEWHTYQNSDLRSMNPFFREKVETALGWKKDDVDAAREIAEQVLGAVRIVDAEDQVPEENERRHTRYRELAHLLSGMGDMMAGLDEQADAKTLWDLGGKYKRLAKELRDT